MTSDRTEARKGPKEVYATLQDLIKLQFEARGFSFLPKYLPRLLITMTISVMKICTIFPELKDGQRDLRDNIIFI